MGEIVKRILDSIANYKGGDEDDDLVALAQVDPESFTRFLEEIGKTSDSVAKSILERARAIRAEMEDAHVATQEIRPHGHAALFSRPSRRASG